MNSRLTPSALYLYQPQLCTDCHSSFGSFPPPRPYPGLFTIGHSGIGFTPPMDSPMMNAIYIIDLPSISFARSSALSLALPWIPHMIASFLFLYPLIGRILPRPHNLTRCEMIRSETYLYCPKNQNRYFYIFLHTVTKSLIINPLLSVIILNRFAKITYSLHIKHLIFIDRI